MPNSKSPAIAPLFGEIIRRHRADAGISQEELAFRAGVDRTFISRLEKGIRQPTITTVMSLAQALGVSATALMKETEERYLRNAR